MTTNFLTKEGFQKLQEELDYLRTAKRQEVAERLHEAMEGGELIENAEYEAAKTFSMLKSTPGEAGGIFRDPKQSKDLRKQLKDAEAWAEKQCFVK